MLSPTSGRTAPRLLLDILSLDTSGEPLLTPPPSPPQNSEATTTFAPPKCRHSLMIKLEQSVLPELDYRPNSSSVFKVASYCCHCRWSFDVTIDYRSDSTKSGPCPNREYPLHHFGYMPIEAKSMKRLTFAGDYEEVKQKDPTGLHIQRWKCTSPQCPARLSVRVRSPRLGAAEVDLLISPARLKRRLDVAFNNQPDRFEGVAVASPALALNYLRTYITDALNPTRDGRSRFSDRNKQFLVGLGEDSAPLLEALGFIHEAGFWYLPQPGVPADYSGGDQLRWLLDDVKNELISLIYQYPAHERHALTSLQVGERPARKELERVLGTLDYEKSLSSRTINLVDDQERPFYAGLGAVFDFADGLIIFAHDRQSAYDPANTPYYFECLQEVARERNSEELATKVAMLESEGQISRKEVLEAYRYFGLDGTQAAQIDDDQIIGTYRSRLADSPRNQENEMRNALRILGTARGSPAIQQAAANIVETYDQALAWLDITADTPDDFVASMYTMKTAENANNQDLARRAVDIIANVRNSESLRGFLQTGDTMDSTMDLTRAYELYGIPRGTALWEVDADGLRWQHSNNVKEQPSRKNQLDSALKVIAEHHPRPDLKAYANASSGANTSADTSNKPLGLENLGNTCYLNSLLQHLFVIRPLRQLVLDFDQHKVDLTLADSLKGKKVGSSQVNYASARRGQEFMAKLRELFEQMIEAPSSRDTAKPEVELARLALVRAPMEPPRRRSTMSGSRPEIATAQDRNSDVPAGRDNDPAALPVVNEEAIDTVENDSAAPVDDAMSDVTLIDDNADANVEQEDTLMADAVKDGPAEGSAVDRAAYAASTITGSRPLDSHVNAGEDNISHPTLDERESAHISSSPVSSLPHPAVPDETNTLESGPPPSRAPPVPPRPKRDTHEAATVEDQDLSQVALQQDVSEVLESVINKMRSAIKSEGRDDDGEQVDDVRSLFYGKSKVFTTKPDGRRTSIEGIFADVQVSPLEGGSCDIYTALDKEFDLGFLPDGSAQYTTLSALPQLLQIHIRRGQWNLATGQAYKNNELIKPVETLYLDRYVDTDDRKLMSMRSDKWAIKTRLRELEQRRQVLLRIPSADQSAAASLSSDVGSLPEALEMTAGYLDSLRAQINEEDSADEEPLIIEDAVIEAIKQKAESIRTDISQIDAKVDELTQQLYSLFFECHSYPYRLEAVFMHRGQAGHGHYWIYLYDPKRSMWRKYNDERVEENPNIDEIFVEGAANSATAYYLVYVRDDKKEELIDCVCRHPKEPQQDTEMEGSDNSNFQTGGESYSEPYPGAFQTTPANGTWDNSEAYQPNVKW